MSLSTIMICAEHFGVNPRAVIGQGRTRTLVLARNAAMYALRHRDGISYPVIGRLFDGRDHSTAIHNIRAAADRAVVDADYRALLDRLMALPKYYAARILPRRPESQPELFREAKPALRALSPDELPPALVRNCKARNDMSENDPDALRRMQCCKALLAAIKREHPARFVRAS